MADFRRQPSKVWWSNFPEENESQISGFLGWGNGIDLSGNFTEEKNNRSNNAEIRSLNTLNTSKSEIDANKSKQDLNKSQRSRILDDDHQQSLNWEEPKIETSNWENSDLTGNRGSSSSPSQGSHKSQDSGFSDSEIQHHANSPQDSPDLSKRLECNQCSSNNIEEEAKQENENLPPENNNNETIINYKKSKTSIQKFSYHVVEFPEDFNEDNPKFLETAFDLEDSKIQYSTKATEETESNINKIINLTSSPKQSKRRNLIKTHISRTKNDNEKINQIQNQLELSFKLPKKINSNQNVKVSNLIITQFQARPSCNGDDHLKRTSSFSENEDQTSGSVTSLKSCSSDHTVIEKPKIINDNKEEAQLDSEGFKIPKKLSEQNINCKGSNNFLDLTDIEGPPISSSTPKSSKNQRQESPVPKAARAAEKTVVSTSTFATIRKLKGLSEKKIKRPINLLASFNR